MSRETLGGSRRTPFIDEQENSSADSSATDRTITRADLARAIQNSVGLSRAEANELIETVLGEIFQRLVDREEVKLSSFGTFCVREKRERAGRNPKTGVGAKISARLVVSFKPSNILRSRITKR
jgi:integration host factor subunit alpha